MRTLKERAWTLMPGGVNSPVRAFASVGGNPLFAARGEGPFLETTDGRRLIDYCMSFGPLILGHAHADVVQAITKAAGRGTSYAVTTEAELEMATILQEAIPSMERVRLVSSGTEACMTALRLARGATGKNKVLKFSGCYHGHSDGLLVQAGSGVAGIAAASSAGIPEEVAGQTLVAGYNNIEQVEEIVQRHGDDLAAIIVEPVAANMGLVPPAKNFLEGLKKLCDQSGTLLIFDEVISGFRYTFGGYQQICGLQPDLTCLGKVIGGGMPIGAIGGSEKLMNQLAPLGPVYQAGTLSGNPISVAAGLATLTWLRDHNPYDALKKKTLTLLEGIRLATASQEITVQLPHLGSVFSMFFADHPVESFEAVQQTEHQHFEKIFHHLLEQGVYIPPSPFEVSFVSTAHSDEEIAATIDAFEDAFAQALC